VAANGNSIAVRGADGRLSIASSRRDRFTVRDWLAADADGRAANDPSLTASVRCDPIGCIVPLGNGRRLAALSLSLEAMAEDCRRAAVIASPQEAPPGCAALVIDRKMWRRSGAVALYPSGDGFTVEQTRPPGYDRPWAPAYRVRSTSAAAAKARARAGAAAPDATPPSEALQADD
jgi:competence protein ComEC